MRELFLSVGLLLTATISQIIILNFSILLNFCFFSNFLFIYFFAPDKQQLWEQMESGQVSQEPFDDLKN